MGAPPGQIRVVGKGWSQGFGRAVVPVPIQELVAEKGPVPPDVGPSGRPGLFFEFNKSELTQMSHSILVEMGKWLSTEEDEVRVEGHCDPPEKDTTAQQRSVTVKNALVSAGVNPTRLRLMNCAGQHPASSTNP